MTEKKQGKGGSKRSIKELFEEFPEMDEFSHCCNEYLEVRSLMDVRNLDFFEKVAVVTALLKIDVRRHKINIAREENLSEAKNA